MYRKNPYGKELFSKDQILLCNTKSGGYLRTNKVYYQYLESLMQENQGVMNWEVIEDDNVKKNIKHLFTQLLSIGYMIHKDDLYKMQKEEYEVIYLCITNRCNLRCRHCCVSAGEEVSQKELNITEWETIIDQVIQLNPNKIEVSGGEALLYHEFQRLIQYLRTKYSGKISLSTNALLIDDNNIERIRENVDSLSISIDGYDEESCKQIRGEGVFNKVIDRIRYLKENEVAKISASMLITPYTENKENEFKKLCSDLDITPFFRKFSPSGRGKDNYRELIPEKDVIENIDSKDLYCALCKPGRRELSISSNGDVYPCGGLSSIEELRMGNLLKDPISSILNNTAFEDEMERLRPWNMDKCKECNVNIFCHSCISYILDIQQDLEMFEKVCERHKTVLTKVIWG